MSDYESDLKVWGGSGYEWPDNYYHIEGEAPVDAWENRFKDETIENIEHLIELTNERIESSYGSSSEKPDNPENGEQYWDNEEDVLEVYDSSYGAWKDLAFGQDLRQHWNDTSNPHNVTLDSARSEDNELSGPVNLGGNNLNSVDSIEFDSDDVRVAHESGVFNVEELDNGTWSSRLSIDNTGAVVNGDSVILQPDLDSVETSLSGDIDTVSGNLQSHDDSTDNPHSATLEQVRTVDNTFDGNVDLDLNDLENVGKVSISDVEVDGALGSTGEVITYDETGNLIWGEGYTDSKAISAVNSESTLSVDISGDADTVDGNDASDFYTRSQVDTRLYTDDEARSAVDGSNIDSIQVSNDLNIPVVSSDSETSGNIWLRDDL